MLQNTDSSFASTDSTRRRSTFYVPLVSDPSSTDTITTTNLDDIKRSLELIYNPDLSACSFEWSLEDSLNRSSLSNDGNVNVSPSGAEYTGNGVNIATVVNMANTTGAKAKRYGVVLNGIDLDDEQCHQQSQTSTPKKMLAKSQSRSSIPDRTFNAASPALKEKSATLPQNMSPANTFPPKHSFLLKSSPKILFNYSSDAAIATTTTPSPKKTLSFIRRAHSTKLSRSNSLLKSLTSKCVDQSVDNLCRIVVDELQFDRLERFFNAENCTELILDMFFKVTTPSAASEATCRRADDNDIHSGKFRFFICFSILNRFGERYSLDTFLISGIQ